MNTDNKISRRDALKRMGAAVISGTVASSGLLSLTSCGGKKTSALSFILPERATACISPASWPERIRNCSAFRRW